MVMMGDIAIAELSHGGWFYGLATASGLLATEGGFGLSFDLLESNIVNLAIVIGILVYFGRGFLGKMLTQRRSDIETAIAEAETRQANAAQALAEQQQKLAQAQEEAGRIVAAAQETAAKVKADILAKSERDIARMREDAGRDTAAEQERVIAQLRQRAVSMALARVDAQLREQLDDGRQGDLIDRSLALLNASGGSQ
jgi:F-type H+-transporting ATPase subunit b